MSHERSVVVHVITRMILGGPTRPVLAALSRLPSHGLSPVLITGPPAAHELPDRQAYEAIAGLQVIELRELVRDPAGWRDLRATLTLIRKLRRFDPMLIHTHTAKAGALGRLAGWFLGSHRPPAVHTFHGHSLSRAAAGRMAPVWRTIERGLARFATDLVLTLSPRQRQEIVDLLGRKLASRVVVQPLAFDFAMCPEDLAESRRFTAAVRRSDERLLAFVGRGVVVKGLHDLARAHARLMALDLRAGRRLRVTLIGPLEPVVENIVRRVLSDSGLLDQWNFWGPTLNPRPLLEAVDGVVLPSHTEGTPVSILEAFALGLPVIASAVGGVPELLAGRWERIAAGDWRVERTAPRGLLVPSGDIDAWAAALQTFASDPTQIPGDPAERKAFVTTTFDADQHVRDLLELYARAGAKAHTNRIG
ncbi:MAG: glycosyltransferase [Acidobacteriota bacterium]